MGFLLSMLRYRWRRLLTQVICEALWSKAQMRRAFDRKFTCIIRSWPLGLYPCLRQAMPALTMRRFKAGTSDFDGSGERSNTMVFIHVEVHQFAVSSLLLASEFAIWQYCRLQEYFWLLRPWTCCERPKWHCWYSDLVPDRQLHSNKSRWQWQSFLLYLRCAIAAIFFLLLTNPFENDSMITPTGLNRSCCAKLYGISTHLLYHTNYSTFDD